MSANAPHETFQPRPLRQLDSPWGRARFQLRLLGDFQTLTTYRHLKAFLPRKRGAVLDLGCGGAPYRALLSKTLSYEGADWVHADAFGYHDPSVLRIEGSRIPVADASLDYIVCTEVLEHVEDFPALIAEMFRVLKPGGEAFVTIPWSARYHYIPHDYWRFTPSALKRIFERFADVEVRPRGTDLTVIANKWIVANLGLLARAKTLPTVVLAAVLESLGAPLLAGAVALGHLSLWFGWGSSNDPLGYTITFRRGP